MKDVKLLITLCVLLTSFLVSGAALANETLVFEPLSYSSSLAAPTLTVTTYGTTVSLSWTSVTGAIGYTLYYAPYPFTGPDSIKNIPLGTETSMTASLWNGAAFFVAIQAYNYESNSNYSNIGFFVISNSQSSTFIYEALTAGISSSEFIAQANDEGKRGYRYLDHLAFGSSDIVVIYVKDNSQSSTFIYEALTAGISSSEFIAQANDEGKKGYRYLDHLAFGSSDIVVIYVKDNSQSSTFIYEALTAGISSSEFIAQANDEGKRGYRYLDHLAFGSSGIVVIYVKDNSQSSTFIYEALTAGISSSEFIAQANDEGKKGYRYLDHLAFGSSDIVVIYVKDNSQSSTFIYEALTAGISASEFIAQANDEGKRGYKYLDHLAFGSSDIVVIYVKDNSLGVGSSR